MFASRDADQQGQTLVSGGRDGMLRIWSVRRPDPFVTPKPVPQQWGLQEGAYAPQGGGMLLGSVAAVENDKSQVTLWDLRSENPQPDIRVVAGFEKSKQ